MNISAKDDRESYKHIIWGIDIFRQMSSRHVVVMVDSNPSLNKVGQNKKQEMLLWLDVMGC